MFFAVMLFRVDPLGGAAREHFIPKMKCDRF